MKALSVLLVALLLGALAILSFANDQGDQAVASELVQQDNENIEDKEEIEAVEELEESEEAEDLEDTEDSEDAGTFLPFPGLQNLCHQTRALFLFEFLAISCVLPSFTTFAHFGFFSSPRPSRPLLRLFSRSPFVWVVFVVDS